jgi:hypothetical protein
MIAGAVSIIPTVAHVIGVSALHVERRGALSASQGKLEVS